MSPVLHHVVLILATFTSHVLGNDGPQFTHLEENIVVNEDIPVGTILTNITAVDYDGPQELYFYIPLGHPSSQYVEFQNIRGDSQTGRTVDLVLKAELDRDYVFQEKNFLKIRFIVEDNHGELTGNEIPREITMYIKDVNDESPTFESPRYEPTVPENTSVGTSIVTVKANDPDKGLDGVVSYSMESVGQAVSEDYKNAFRIDSINGTVFVNGSLDASLHYIYEYKLIAKDHDDLEGNSILLIKIQDVQDKPPYFTNLPYSVTIPETTPLNSQVLQVTALDGDRRIPNEVTYSIVSGEGRENFDLHPTTGWISIKTKLDRDSPEVRQRGGVYAIIVMATEQDTGNQPLSSITATTLVTITVSDVNDNAPRFNSPTYHAYIQENMEEGVPITFNGSISVMNASDVDQGSNSHFELFLLKDGLPYNDFAPLPTEVFSESSILIRVNNKSALDYERVTSVTFQIVAREMTTTERLSSVATVILEIQDMNDNTPSLPQNYPVLNISEDASVGTELIELNATDLDRGNKGKITYSIRGSDNLFKIDKDTGRITLDGQLDREKVDTYFITAEARDGGGLTTTANLEIHVTDVNDNRPVFRREEYYATVREDSKTFLRGTLTVEAVDDDEPNTPNSLVMYRIVGASAGLEDKFFVNQSTGMIILRDTVDHEVLPAELNGRVILEVEAYDQGNPSLATSINITIEIEDVNDNRPAFNQTKYTATIPESAGPGTSVVTVFAIDLDSTTPNNAFLYRIDSGAGDKFRINFDTGVITVELGAKLDRETKDFYSLKVSATDRGAKSLTGYCDVEISVTDVNDERPVFQPDTLQGQVREDRDTGYEVVCATAVDPDQDNSLMYSIIPGSVTGLDENSVDVNVSSTGLNQYFSVDSTSGCVMVNSVLDRETAEVVMFKVLATDTNAILPASGINLQTATATVSITLLDFNDNPPIFISPSPPYNQITTYDRSISEGVANWTEVMRFETQDADKDQTVLFRLVSDPTNNFMIAPGTDLLRLRAALDRESYPVLDLIVEAVDAGTPPLSSSVTVHINIGDINDNNPTFLPYNLVYTVREDVPLDHTVATISAVDRDTGEFAKIVYSLEVSQNDSRIKVDAQTGRIYVAKALDREAVEEYTLYVFATDNPRAESADQKRTNQTKAIKIQVTDVNDNSPYFTNIDPDTKASVFENADRGDIVFTVSAEDDDAGENSRLEYGLIANDTIKDLFIIETASKTIGRVPKYFGDIKVDTVLVGMVGEMNVKVTVKDNGVPIKSAETSLTIVIEDKNLNPPVFVDPPGPRATLSTLEEEPIGSLIKTIRATDADHGRNAELTYTIQQEGDYEMFDIEPKSGNLTNAKKLNREVQAVYEIKVQAKDNGIPNPRYSDISLTISLIDVNDQPPEFPRGRDYRPYVIMMKEETTDVAQNLSIAVDRDADANALTCYYIIGGDDAKTNFSLSQQGNLTLITKVDRESLDDYSFVNLIILATPRCGDNSITDDLRPAVFPPTDYSSNLTLLWVQVNVEDINDNPPKFRQSLLTIGVTRDAGYGSALVSLQDLVTDEDATKKVTFHELRTEQHLQGPQVPGVPFKVFPNGTVATNTYFQTNMYGYFLVFVQAEEKVEGGEPFIANATLRISLVNDDQRVKVVFRYPPDAVRAFQVMFNKKLEETIGYRVVLDKIQTHENSFGQPEVNKTDMLIHGEDFKTNATIPAQELLRVIDNYAELLLGLRFQYKVLEIVPTVKQVEEDSLENVYKMALILVTIVLSLLCIGICIVFYISRQQYKRKLKAATAMAYVSLSNSDKGATGRTLSRVKGKVWRQMVTDNVSVATADGGSSSDLQKLEMPGTNVHAYENVNPIYLEKVMLEESGEQNDDDSLDENAVDASKSPSAFSEQQMSLNFYTEDKNLNKIPQAKLGSGDAILNSVLQQHEAYKAKSVQNGNGHMATFKQDNFEGLPTTEI